MQLTVSSMDLCINLDSAVLGNHFIGDRNALMDRDTLFDNGVVFHARCRVSQGLRWDMAAWLISLGHAKHTIDLGDAQPVQDLWMVSLCSPPPSSMRTYIWHESLETHVLSHRLALSHDLTSNTFTFTPAIFSVLLKYSLAPAPLVSRLRRR